MYLIYFFKKIYGINIKSDSMYNCFKLEVISYI